MGPLCIKQTLNFIVMKNTSYTLAKAGYLFSYANKVAFLLILILINTACQKSKFKTPMEGEKYGGGIVLHIFTPNEKGYVIGETHGIIVAEKDLHGLKSFGLTQVNLSGLTSIDIGYGKSNTEAIVNAYPDSATAAKFCNDVKINYYDDWFLPSINELNLIFEKRHSIGNFSSDYSSHYWASTSYDDETSSGAFSRFFNTASICVKSKDELFHIRPVRYF
jgi:hypothetical protein